MSRRRRWCRPGVRPPLKKAKKLSFPITFGISMNESVSETFTRKGRLSGLRKKMSQKLEWTTFLDESDKNKSFKIFDL